MTPPPTNGPNAPTNAGYGASDAAPAYPGWGAGTGGGPDPVFTSTPLGGSAPAEADAPTGTMPLVTGTHAPQQPGTSTPPTGTGADRSRANGSGRQRGTRARGPRRARLQLRHIDPWTVLKFSCVLSIALFFVWLIVIGVLYGVLDGAGVIGKINDAVTTINGGNAKPPVTAGIVFGGAAIIGVVNIVLFIALSTIGSVVYNLCADLVGGIEVTLSER